MLYHAKSRSAFTIIEVILVIVIIAILAAIAISKLAVTRDDAKSVSIVANMRSLTEDMKDFYTSQGQTRWRNAKVAEVTDVMLYLDPSCNNIAKNSLAGHTTLYICSDQSDIVKFDTNATHLTISPGSDTSSAIYKILQNDTTFTSLMGAHRLGGSAVKR